MIWRAGLDTGTVVLTEAPEFDEGKPYTRKVPDHRIVHYRLRDGSVIALVIPQRKDRRPLVAVIPLDLGGLGGWKQPVGCYLRCTAEKSRPTAV
ncbi:MAG: hypothetical protein CSA70_12165 [Rhodobacterales bacterium]|nr:MAG: hypothetical protein CR993_01050 [Rhodobacterales bacterium]PIE10089.1 MAG: hypothetical protein CSA70_12165 [Rhodobacterales bacterium]